MVGKLSDNRSLWLGVGLVAGLCISYCWPHEPGFAGTSDRDSKFGMVTCPVSFTEDSEGVFVVDYLTGQLRGSVASMKTGKFTNFYYRNLAADFKVDPKIAPHYALVSGKGQLVGRGGLSMSTGLLYVAELTSGKVVCYAFPFRESTRPMQPVQIKPVDSFSFREAIEDD
jgi:hypothetical protein